MRKVKSALDIAKKYDSITETDRDKFCERMLSARKGIEL